MKSRQAIVVVIALMIWNGLGLAQVADIQGVVLDRGTVVPYAVIAEMRSGLHTNADSLGQFTLKNLPIGIIEISVQAIGFEAFQWHGLLDRAGKKGWRIEMESQGKSLNEVVVTGTLKPVSRSESPIPVEIYSSQFFKKNPSASLFEAMQNISGVRPQNNCNVCNTGDIHINGLEGAYTLVLIDGMPLVSSLGSVYGLFGIPRSLIERVEIVRGPAAALYGSESMGGLINVITKRPESAPTWSAEVSGSNWLEHQIDLGNVTKLGQKWSVLTGLNYYGFQQRVDHDHDGFTDMALQSRISFFQKWRMARPKNKLLSIAARYYYEDRWGGEVEWQHKDRGRDTYYGESIYTNRWECLGAYELPFKEKWMLQWSYIEHHQNSVYGLVNFQGHQRVALAQLTWDKKLGQVDALLGISNRYTFYDDNTPATASGEVLCPVNQPSRQMLPGIFIQTEWIKSEAHRLLLGARLDHHNIHGAIFTPRLAHKWKVSRTSTLRFNLGSGFRVVNLFTEDHAALTGARTVVITETLKPERSTNVSVAYAWAKAFQNQRSVSLDVNLFYGYFQNRILPDYTTDANAIYYANLNGYAENRGVNLNCDAQWGRAWRMNAGITWTDHRTVQVVNGERHTSRPFFTERWSGAWTITYQMSKKPISFDYSGNLYSPMLLPLLGPLDPRSPTSPWWSIQNIQCTYRTSKGWEIFGGVKNLLNWTPLRNNPFLIARSQDPFDKQVTYNDNGEVVPTADNPYALTFDPSYVYAPNQGIRCFLGIRFQF